MDQHQDSQQQADSPKARFTRLVKPALARLGSAASSLARRAWQLLGQLANSARRRLKGRALPVQLLLLGLWTIAGALLAFLAWLVILIPFTPGVDDLEQASRARPTVILAADGTVLGSFEHGLQERVRLSQVSPWVVKALISTEDHRFYEHHGVDFRRVVGAALSSVRGKAQGGSTITQQLARNMFPQEIGRARSVNRKMRELITAIKIENTYSKTQILEAYLNTVPFLYNAYGIEMAARTYFSKSATRLSEVEAATLVGMLKGTYYYNPVTQPERSRTRRNVVLAQMYKHGHLNKARLDTLSRRPLRLHFARQPERSGRDDHFTTHVRKWLRDWAEDNDANLELDGLVVRTTLDGGLQKAALRAVARQADALQAVADVEWATASMPRSKSTAMYTSMQNQVARFDYYWSSHPRELDAFVRESAEYRSAVDGGAAPEAALARLKQDGAFMNRLKNAKSRLEAGFVAIDPTSGAVKAWVGSRDFERDQYDHVALAARQPGSTFKAFVYGAALEAGIAPEQRYRDVVQEFRASDGSIWKPTDMSGSSGREMTMHDGLVFSKNTITAQVAQEVGMRPIMKLAQGLGVRQSKLAPVPSLALGTSPVTLLEMVSSYATIAAQGEYRQPYWVSRIEDRDGNVVADFTQGRPERVLSQKTSENLIEMLRGAVTRGTGAGIRSRFGLYSDLAGKTGTTQNNTDGWFILMHPQLVAGAWVGFNDNRVTLRSSYWGQGGHNAALLVGDFYRNAFDAGALDTQAVFPGGKPPPVRRRAEPVEEVQEVEEVEEEVDELEQLLEREAPPAPAPPEAPLAEPTAPEPPDEPNPRVEPPPPDQ